jgi:3-methyladenine DNA glycosylase AlkD
MSDLADRLRVALQPLGTRERAEHERGYLKSDRIHWGVPVPAIRKVAKAAWREDPTGWRTAVDALWGSGVHELAMAAVELLRLAKRELTGADLPTVEAMLRQAKTWALVDPLAIYVTGDLVAAEPGLASELDRWATGDDVWIRRSALLALLVPLRQGGGDWERFVGYATPMLGEREFFVRKAIGWVLRETGKQRPELVIGYVRQHAPAMAGLTFREATKRLDAEVQAELKALR